MQAPIASGQVRSWVDRIPYDIWYSILKECDSLPTRGGFGCPTLPDRYRTHIIPVTISHVCQTLRSFSLSTPSLWTRISLRIGDHPTRDRGTPSTQLMELFLQRSRDKPLYVTLSVGNFDMAKQRDQHQFLVKLFANSTRWKSAELELDAEWIDRTAWRVWFEATLRNFMPLTLLESIEVRVSATDDPFNRFSVMKLPIELWKASPSITHLAISIRELDPLAEEYDDLDIVPSDFMGWAVQSSIPYSQITHLLLEGGPSTHISWFDIEGIFNAAPNLIVCFLEGICANPSSTLTSPVMLPNLIHLYLEASGLDGVYESLTPGLNRVLTAPALRSLALAYGEESEDSEGPNNRDDWEQIPYTEFITRSSCSLEELRFIKLDVPIDQLLLCMELSPTLKVLHTEFEMDTDPINRFSARLEERRDEDGTSGNVSGFVLCPRLRELGLYSWSDAGVQVFYGRRCSARQTPTEDLVQVVGLDPYYVRTAHDQIRTALYGFRRAVLNANRIRIIYQHYLVLHTIRRSLWHRFKFENGTV